MNNFKANSTNQQKAPASHFSKLALLTIGLFVTSCITVNVNFPETAVQRAADDFVHGLYKNTTAVADTKDNESIKNSVKHSESLKKKQGKVPAAEHDKKDTAKPTTWNLNFLIPYAFAGDLDIPQTPAAIEAQKKMQSRAQRIVDFKNAGALCEQDNGMLKIQDPSKAGQVAELVQQENADRNILFEEFEKAHHFQRRDNQVRQIFANSFKKYPPSACK